ncbi:hypothetical protein DFS34DRAFT_163751 [Phlyctochytrium arcticum]|nr:hypothetical protein DFS34DRAFT_163751 [Phlyctochytrium arcticum]
MFARPRPRLPSTSLIQDSSSTDEQQPPPPLDRCIVRDLSVNELHKRNGDSDMTSRRDTIVSRPPSSLEHHGRGPLIDSSNRVVVVEGPVKKQKAVRYVSSRYMVASSAPTTTTTTTSKPKSTLNPPSSHIKPNTSSRPDRTSAAHTHRQSLAPRTLLKTPLARPSSGTTTRRTDGGRRSVYARPPTVAATERKAMLKKAAGIPLPVSPAVSVESLPRGMKPPVPTIKVGDNTVIQSTSIPSLEEEPQQPHPDTLSTPEPRVSNRHELQFRDKTTQDEMILCLETRLLQWTYIQHLESLEFHRVQRKLQRENEAAEAELERLRREVEAGEVEARQVESLSAVLEPLEALQKLLEGFVGGLGEVRKTVGEVCSEEEKEDGEGGHKEEDGICACIDEISVAFREHVGNTPKGYKLVSSPFHLNSTQIPPHLHFSQLGH